MIAPKTEDDYAAFWNVIRKHRDMDMAWIRHGVPTLRALAAVAQKRSRLAFVLASGPSKDLVAAAEWRAIAENHFTIGVNFFADWFQRERAALSFRVFPWINALADVIAPTDELIERAQLTADEISARAVRGARLHAAYVRSGGYILTSYDDSRFPSHFNAPVTARRPHDDLEYGLSLSPGIIKFNRCSYMACDLAQKLGFDVALLGVDHGADYLSDDSGRAQVSFGQMHNQMAKCGLKLWRAGAKAAYDSVPYCPLGDLLAAYSVASFPVGAA